MISTGAHFRGPELSGSAIEKLLDALGRLVIENCGNFVGGEDVTGQSQTPPAVGRVFPVGSKPAVNIIFYVPGSLGDFDIPKVEAARFSRKQKLLLVAVPVPKELVDSGGSVEFVRDALHKANAIAAETFARKGPDEFEFAKAEEIVETVTQSLLADGFEEGR